MPKKHEAITLYRIKKFIREKIRYYEKIDSLDMSSYGDGRYNAYLEIDSKIKDIEEEDY